MFRNLSFEPGKALRKTELWMQDVQLLKHHHYPVPEFAENMIKKGVVGFTHPHIYNRSRRKVTFNSEEFDNIERCELKYRSKQDPNYNGAREQEVILRKMVEEYEACGILREPENNEYNRVVINPVNAWLTKFGFEIRENLNFFVDLSLSWTIIFSEPACKF